MLKKIRVSVSILLVTILLFSPFIFFKTLSAQACPPPPPETLISLFLRSDLIVVADFTSRKDGAITTDEETYQYVDVINDLKVSKVLKGSVGDRFSFKTSEYRDKTPPEEISVEEEIEIYKYTPYGYQLYSEMTLGNRYLFFFTKEDNNENYYLSDDTTGFRNLNDRDLSIFENRIAELQSILDDKENQLSRLTDWYIKCIEEPATRWDGVMSLQSSFNALEYEDEADIENREKFVFDKSFSEYTPEIAENLTVSQKNFLSEIVFSSLQQKMSEGNSYDFYISLDQIIKQWDKQRLAMYAFSLFQTADKSDAEKTENSMIYISSVVEDEQLWETISDYRDAEETAKSLAKASAEGKNSETAEIIETKTVENEAPPTADQLRQKALQDFTNRYYHLLARNFVEEGDEVAVK